MFYKDKKVVVTGGSGFVGSHYLLELLDRGAIVKTHTHIKPLQILDDRIEVLDNIDLENIDDCFKLVEGADYVIHSGGQICHPSNVSTDIQVSIQNIKVTGNILEASYKSEVKGYLDLNSSTGYPDRRYPITENISDMKIALTRGTAIFGPYDNFNPKTCHVVPALINRVLSGENPLEVWGTPDVVRDFLYVKDVVNGALLVLEKGESMKPYNLGYGSTITVGDIVDCILKGSNMNPEVYYDESKPTTIPFRMVSTDRIKNELGFKPMYTFEQGIRKTVDWYLKNKMV